MERNIMLKELNDQLTGKSIEEALEKLASVFKGKVIFTTSFGIEDQVITHIIFSNNFPVRVVTLDTGRLFRQTYDVYSETIIKYKKKIDIYFPEYQAVEWLLKRAIQFLRLKGKQRRVLQNQESYASERALEGMECWISGIRASQSDNRSQMNDLEYDETRKLFKYHPLFRLVIRRSRELY